MKLQIETGEDNKILRAKSQVVKEITKKTQKFIKDMEKSMKNKKGVGLAAPQVGINERIIVVLLNEKKIISMINPEITYFSEETVIDEEGCLSLPGVWGNVERAGDIIVQFLTTKGDKIIMKLDGFNARIIQHEIDHLNGILFTDYLEEDELSTTGEQIV